MATVKIGSNNSIRVLKLGPNNWVIYKTCLAWAADTKGYTGHLDGTVAEPVAPTPPAPTSSGTAPTTPATVTTTPSASPPTGVDANAWKAYLTKFTVYQTAVLAWKKGEATVKQLIVSMLSDSQFMKICTLSTAHTIWSALTKEFENKSHMVSVDLHRCLHEMHCGECDDVCEHFTKMCTVREDLSVMGHPSSEEDFYVIVFGSMSASYKPYISSISATSIITGTVLTPDRLMDADGFLFRYPNNNSDKVMGASHCDPAPGPAKQQSCWTRTVLALHIASPSCEALTKIHPSPAPVTRPEGNGAR